MARSEKNLTAVFTDTASAIRAKTGTTETICPLDFADKINAIETGGGGGMKAYFEAGGKCGNSKVKTFDGIINYSDTENVKNMTGMFFQCEFISTGPNIDTSNATRMDGMFLQCANITSIPKLNTSNVTNMSDMFNSCASLTTIPKLDTSKVNNMRYMFDYCSSLITIPDIDTSKVTSMRDMFNGCSSLTVVPRLDMSNVTDNLNYMFGGCTSLTEIHTFGMKVDFAIHASTLFSREALVEIINNLATVTSTQTLRMGETNLAKLTDEDKAIAINKGWTLA